jgi:hypothetical protein
MNEPPRYISGDGREIWDWAAGFSRKICLLDKQNTLSRRIANLKIKCGSCSRWMKNSCPKERLDNRKGHKVGPHCDSHICGEFEMSKITEQLIAELQQEFDNLGGRP